MKPKDDSIPTKYIQETFRTRQSDEDRHRLRQQRKDEYSRHTQKALAENRQLGAMKDTEDFLESDFPLKYKHHELPGLCDAQNFCQHCVSFRWKEERPSFCKGRLALYEVVLP